MTKNSYMIKVGEKAKIASLNLSKISIDKRNSVLRQFSEFLKMMIADSKLVLTGFTAQN